MNPLREPTPPHIFDARLRELVVQSIARIRSDLIRWAPQSAGEMNYWIDRQSEPESPEDCFRGLKAHFLLIPWFLGLHIQGHIDYEFQRELVYSSINAYYFVRLIDNITDGHSPGDSSLLPLAALFHTNFHATYAVWFEPRSPFWGYFNRFWIGMADATVRNSKMQMFSESEFVAVSSKKISAVKIPVVAACFRYQRPDLLGPWLSFYDSFACFHEMMDDFCDWYPDLAQGRSSFLLSEASRRKHLNESMDGYLVREGLGAGYAKIRLWLAETISLADGLRSRMLDSFLQYRCQQAESFWRSISPSLDQLKDLVDVLEGCPHGNG
jgi:hypothetical protein